MASLPRREFIKIEHSTVTPPMMEAATFEVSIFKTFQSFLKWIWSGSGVLGGNLWDVLNRKDSEAQRANRIRKLFENNGGTFRKIGRMLAMRLDILPWSYSVELSQVIDQMAPFPVEQAIEIITGVNGQELSEIFEQFDPEPILSTSIACTYQAYLKTGDKVAVKVRRPGIGPAFMADLKALEWIIKILEFTSILRPGFTQNMQREMRETIEDELNFTLEARHQTLFRSEAKKSGKRFFTAPQVYHDLSNQAVVVKSFTTGMWLWELLAAVEQNDTDALNRATALNIDPKLVARRLLWINFWGLDEHKLFRADINPENVIVRKNSKLTFIDFNAIGSLTQEKREAVQQIMINAWNRDPLEMAQESLVLLEPLPPIDTNKFIKELETNYWQFLYALESDRVEWWERTSARLWLGFVQIAREHNVTMNINVLRMIRSCLLHDAMAARLSEKINHVEEYQRFTKYRAEAARNRFEARIRGQIESGIDNRIYLQIEQVADTSERLFRQLQRFLSTPMLKFNAVLGKSVYSLWVLFRLLGQVATLVGLGLAIVFGSTWITRQPVPGFTTAFEMVYTNRIFQIGILFLLLINFRTMLFRLGDKDA